MNQKKFRKKCHPLSTNCPSQGPAHPTERTRIEAFPIWIGSWTEVKREPKSEQIWTKFSWLFIKISKPSLLGATPDPKYPVIITLSGGPPFRIGFQKIEGPKRTFFFARGQVPTFRTCRPGDGSPCVLLKQASPLRKMKAGNFFPEVISKQILKLHTKFSKIFAKKKSKKKKSMNFSTNFSLLFRNIFAELFRKNGQHGD